MVLYRKYRPQKFTELVGQKSIREVLLAQLSDGKIGHAYLFCGPKGTGKTSTARIFAKALNCEKYKNQKQKFGEPCGRCTSCLAVADGSHLDLIEIDAASNRSIDDVRELREKVKLSPVFSKFKVYIIDEAHMLTREAFNAFLKTLEEPPSHVVFIFCTTEAEKLPQTIVSRMQRLNFNRATEKELIEVISKISKEEGIKADDAAVSAIAAAGDGSFRDSLSILDQVAIGKKKISEDDIAAFSQVSSWQFLFGLGEKFAARDLALLSVEIEKLYESGSDISLLGRELALFFERLLLVKIGILREVWGFSPEQTEKMSKLSEEFSFEELESLIKLLVIAESEMKYYPLPHIPLVLAAFKFSPKKNSNGNMELEKPEKQEEEADPPEDFSEKKTVDPKEENPIRPGSIKKVEKRWGEFLRRVKEHNAHVQAVLRSTRPISLLDGILTLEVFYKFHKEKLEEPKINKMLEKVWEEELHQKIGMKFVLAARDKKVPKPVSASNVVDTGAEDLEALASEVFSK